QLLAARESAQLRRLSRAPRDGPSVGRDCGGGDLARRQERLPRANARDPGRTTPRMLRAQGGGRPVTDLACVGGLLALAFVSAFVPLVSIELALIAAAAASSSQGLLFALVLAAAGGQMLGKSCFFLGGRSVGLWASRRTSDRRPRSE